MENSTPDAALNPHRAAYMLEALDQGTLSEADQVILYNFLRDRYHAISLRVDKSLDEGADDVRRSLIRERELLPLSLVKELIPFRRCKIPMEDLRIIAAATIVTFLSKMSFFTPEEQSRFSQLGIQMIRESRQSHDTNKPFDNFLLGLVDLFSRETTLKALEKYTSLSNRQIQKKETELIRRAETTIETKYQKEKQDWLEQSSDYIRFIMQNAALVAKRLEEGALEEGRKILRGLHKILENSLIKAQSDPSALLEIHPVTDEEPGASTAPSPAAVKEVPVESKPATSSVSDANNQVEPIPAGAMPAEVRRFFIQQMRKARQGYTDVAAKKLGILTIKKTAVRLYELEELYTPRKRAFKDDLKALVEGLIAQGDDDQQCDSSAHYLTDLTDLLEKAYIQYYQECYNIIQNEKTADAPEIISGTGYLRIYDPYLKDELALLAEQNRERLEKLKYYDDVSGLPNQSRFLEDLARLIAVAQDPAQPSFLLFYRIDNIEEIIAAERSAKRSDVIAGEAAEMMVSAGFIKALPGETVQAYRYDTDTVALILPSSPEEIGKRAKQVRAKSGVRIGKKTLKLCVGGNLIDPTAQPPTPDVINTLVHAAQKALQRNKAGDPPVIQGAMD